MKLKLVTGFIVSLNSYFFPLFQNSFTEKKMRETVINIGRTWACTEASSSWCKCLDLRYLCRKKILPDEGFVELKTFLQTTLSYEWAHFKRQTISMKNF